MKNWYLPGVALFFGIALYSLGTSADPYPPTWSNGAGASIHYQPVTWPAEPANPVNCGLSCGDWKPYTRFQQNMNDPRTQDPSNGGTSPQAYVNVASSCSDKNLPSIYYYLYQGATPADDVLMFRWRVESAPHNYATGPSAGSYGASNPWSSALWTVFFDIDGGGYRSLAAHLDGSSGAPSAAVDRLVGIWGESATQSLDYLNDPRVHLLGHNPTAFVGPTGKIMNFTNGLSPNENWPNGANETTWNYGTTRAKSVTQNSCTEYFIDYQIPIALLDASAIGGPKITRSTPISMLFCTANSLNNPFQKDCAVNKAWGADAGKAAPFGDYLSFNQTAAYSQPIISKVEATPPTSCPGNYALKATVQDTLALQSGNVVTSVQSVDFYYWLDTDGDGTANEVSGQWTKITPTATQIAGTLNQWTATWATSSLPKGKYLIGVQALDDNTKLDDGMIPTGINNRTFSYLSGDAANKIYINNAWQSGQQALFPTHSPSQSPAAQENWFGNPNVTGQQIAVIGTAINACGVAPTMSLSANKTSLVANDPVTFTLTFSNPAANTQAVTFSQINAILPNGFTYQTSTTSGTNGLGTADPSIAAQTLTWNYGAPVSLAAGASMTLAFTATATSTAGYYNLNANATTSFGAISASPIGMSVDAARLNLNIVPDSYSLPADNTTTVTFTFNYVNDSVFNLTGGSITSTLPAGATYVSCTGGSACSNNAGNLNWTVGNLAAKSSSTATLTVKLPTSWNSSSLGLSGTLSATAPDASIVSTNATASIAVTGYSTPGVAAMSLIKTASAARIAPSATVTYTLSYSNTGNATASNVVITDTLPNGMSYTSSTGSGSHSSGVVTWNIGSVAAGVSGSVTVTATAAAAPFTYPNPTTNTATINWTGGSAVTADTQVGITGNYCSAVFYFRQGANNNLATIRPASQSAPASSTTYTTTLSNISDNSFESYSTEPNQVVFEQNAVLGSSLNISNQTLTVDYYLSAAQGGGRSQVILRNDTQNTTIATSNEIQINSGAGSWYSFTATVPASTTINANDKLRWYFQFRASGGKDITFHYDSVSINSRSSFCVASAPALLSLSGSVSQASIVEATTPTLTYTLKYINTGGSTANNVVLVGALPSGFTNCEYSTNNSIWNSCSNVAGAAHNFALGSIASNTSGTVYVRGGVPGGTSAGNTLTASPTITSNETSLITKSITMNVVAAVASGSPNIALQLSADKSSVVPGENVTYTLKAINLGNASATNVVISNALPIQSYYTYNSCTGCSQNTGTLTWAAGTFTAGQTKTYSYTMTAGTSGLSAGVYSISDNLSATGDAAVSATSNSVTINISGNPELTANISATPNSGLSPGDIITYNASVQNSGNATATSVIVFDPVPEYTEFYSDLTASTGTASFDTINNRIVIDAGNLSASATVTFSFKARVKALASGSTNIINTATVSATNAGQKNFSTTATASAAPVLELSQSLTGASAYPSATINSNATSSNIFVDTTDHLQLNQLIKIGSQIRRILALGARSITLDSAATVTAGDAVIGALTLNIAYQNTGDATAAAVALSDVLPNGLGFYSAIGNSTAPAQDSSGTVNWSLGDLAPGEMGTQSILVFPTGVTGALTVAGSLQATNATTATANVDVVVGGISLKKETTTPVLIAGNTATYRITLTNSLATPVFGITVTDTLSPGFAYVSSSATVGGVANEPQFAGSDIEQLMPTWSNVSIAANSTLVIEFQANTSVSLGGGTYQNELMATAPVGIGVTPFDAISSTTEDVTLLGSNKGLLNGYVFYTDRSGASNFDSSTDLPLANVRVEIYKTGADCSDPYSATCYVVYTNAQGYFEKIIAAEGWYVNVVTSGDLNGSWNQIVGTNNQLVIVPDQSSVLNENGFSPANTSSSSIVSSSSSIVSSASSIASSASSIVSSSSSIIASASSSISSSVQSSSEASSLQNSSESSSAGVISSISSVTNSSISSSAVSSSVESSSSLGSSSASSSELSSIASSNISSSITSSSSSSVESSSSISSVFVSSSDQSVSAVSSSSINSSAVSSTASSTESSSAGSISSSSSIASSVESSSASSIASSINSSVISSTASSGESSSAGNMSSSSSVASSVVSSSVGSTASSVGTSSSTSSMLTSSSDQSASEASSTSSDNSSLNSSHESSAGASQVSSSSALSSSNSSSSAPSIAAIDTQGNLYNGETLLKNQRKSFRVVGNTGPLKMIASVLQSGNLHAAEELNASSANTFFNTYSAELIDDGNGSYRFAATRAGMFTITFIDSNAQEASLVFVVHPRIAFISTQQQATSDTAVTVNLLLDDDPVEYPVIVPISVENAHLTQNIASDLKYEINQGRKLNFTFTPAVNNGEIIFRLNVDGLENTTLGGLIEHKVMLMEASQLPLNLRLSATQGGQEKTVVRNVDGLVQLSSSLKGDGYVYDWSASNPALQINSASSDQVNVNPATLNGLYLVKLKVTERNSPNRTLTTEIYLRIVAEIPAAYEVFIGSTDSHRLPICIDGGMNRVGACSNELSAIYMETLDDYQLHLGLSSDFASWRDTEFALSIEPKDIVDAAGNSLPNQIDREYTHLGYRVDFELTGLAQVGQSAPIVIPLKPGLTIPANAVWRKYHGGGWQLFISDVANHIASTKRQGNASCPWAGSNDWREGLNAGDDCVRLIIQDGGPNDTDGQADGVIRDPSTLAIRGERVDATTVGKGGGGATHFMWLFLLGSMLLITNSKKQQFLRRKIGE
ncbi:MAG: hypothetical protein B0W54_02105 [Cellvibrio sp. 79]|nr:MAG: hypothetical protein B0W54_02105 [Cellvibrio sp. 79]